jgi:hypothetical protein
LDRLRLLCHCVLRVARLRRPARRFRLCRESTSRLTSSTRLSAATALSRQPRLHRRAPPPRGESQVADAWEASSVRMQWKSPRRRSRVHRTARHRIKSVENFRFLDSHRRCLHRREFNSASSGPHARQRPHADLDNSRLPQFQSDVPIPARCGGLPDHHADLITQLEIERSPITRFA